MSVVRKPARKVSKAYVHYRPAKGKRHCGSCAMFHNGRCDLVEGFIDPKHVCDRWTAK